MRNVCNKDQCTGCMACVNICAKNAIHIVDVIDAFNAVIDEDKCINCGMCEKVCQQKHLPQLRSPIIWKQGWTYDDKTRMKSASGGIATELAKTFIKKGGKVCSCLFREGNFVFDIVEDTNKLDCFAGSKYIKSNPTDIYKTIKKELAKETEILFIGLPCQVAALRNYVGDSLSEKLTTIDLICHGTPSPKILDIFLKQYGENTCKVSSIDFRVKGNFQVSEKSRTIATHGACDRYMISFLTALSYTENCYSCKYAQEKRPGDITLGDSWGTELPENEWKKGISLVLCQTEKGIALLENANVKVVDVNVDKAKSHNHQLEHPSKAPKSRKNFIKHIKHGMKFNRAVFLALPKDCGKQAIKAILIKCKLLTPGGVTYQISINN